MMTADPTLNLLKQLVGSWTTEATHPKMPGVVVHGTESVARRKGKKAPHAWRWTCSCGASTGGKWLRSEQEALKAAQRHVERGADLQPER